VAAAAAAVAVAVVADGEEISAIIIDTFISLNCKKLSKNNHHVRKASNIKNYWRSSYA
jgi:predicted peptidase